MEVSLSHKDTHNKLLLFRQFRKEITLNAFYPDRLLRYSPAHNPHKFFRILDKGGLVVAYQRLQPMEDSSVIRPGTAKQSR